MRGLLSRASCRLAIAAIVAAPALGHADKSNKIVPLVPAMEPPKAGALLQRFHDALQAGVSKTGLTSVAASKVRAGTGEEALPNLACAQSSCAMASQLQHGAGLAAAAAIKTAGKNYAIEVTIYRGGDTVSTSKGRCDICTLMEALGRTEALAQQAAQAAASAAGDSEQPPTAGTSPSSATPAAPSAGSSAATASGAGPAPAGRTDEGKASKTKGWPLWPVLATAGAGVLGLAVGIPLLVIDGDPTHCVGDPLPDTRNCEDIYSTSAGGWVMTAMGLASLAASGVLLYLYLSSRGSEKRSARAGLRQVTVAPLPGGAAIGAGGTF